LSKTLNALLKDEPKQRVDALEGFSLCKTSTCKVVYFRGSEILTQEDEFGIYRNYFTLSIYNLQILK